MDATPSSLCKGHRFPVEIISPNLLDLRGCAWLRAAVSASARSVHDRGRVLVDLAVAIAGGATTISQIDTLRHQSELFASVASDTTVWWASEEITPARLGKVAAVRARARERVWQRIENRHGAVPPARVAGGDLGGVTVTQLDASILLAHSDKQRAGRTFTC